MRSPDALHGLPALAGRVWREVTSDRVMMISAGLAFFTVFALVPALAAAGVLFGSLLDEATLKEQFARLSGVLPEGTADLLVGFMTDLPAGLGFGLTLAVNLLVVLWTVQRSASGVITALNVAYDLEENRSRLKREAVALAIALGGLVFLIASLFLIAIAPLLLPADEALRPLLNLGRWPLLAALFMLALTLLYRYAPHHDPALRPWFGWGPVIAAVLWLAASALFSIYVGYAGYGRFYGPVTAVVVLLLWMFISTLAVMVGAEIDAVIAMRDEGRPASAVKEALHKREGRNPAI